MTFTYEFRPFDGNKIAAFKELFCDTIFKVSNDMKLTPYAVLDLGKYRTPEELRYNITIDDIKNDLFRTKTIPVIPGKSETGSICITSLIKIPIHYIMI